MKYEMLITVKVNSLDSIPALLAEVTNLVRNETDKGMLEKEDSDYIEWKTKINQPQDKERGL